MARRRPGGQPLESVGGFGCPGRGTWANAFGSIVVTFDGTALIVLRSIHVRYGTGSDRRRECKVGALVKPSGTWLTGEVLPDEAAGGDRHT